MRPTSWCDRQNRPADVERHSRLFHAVTWAVHRLFTPVLYDGSQGLACDHDRCLEWAALMLLARGCHHLPETEDNFPEDSVKTVTKVASPGRDGQ